MPSNVSRSKMQAGLSTSARGVLDLEPRGHDRVLGLAAGGHLPARGLGEILDRSIEPGGAHGGVGDVAGDHSGKIALVAAMPFKPHQVEDFRAVEQVLEPRLNCLLGHGLVLPPSIGGSALTVRGLSCHVPGP